MSKDRKSNKTDELELLSPPYPTDDDGPAVLYDRVLALVVFLDYYRESSNKFSGSVGNIARPRAVVSCEEHLKLSLFRMTHLFNSVRRLRVMWDAIVREHESCWGSDKSRLAQHTAFCVAAEILNTAYMSREVLEAHHHAVCQREHANGPLARFFGDLEKHLRGDITDDEVQGP